jgi:maltokinase
VPGDGAAGALLELLRAGGPVPDGFELVVLSPPPAGEPGDGPGEAGIAADQTHESVIAGGAVVKWAVHVEAATGRPPAVAAARQLHAAGFAEMPQPYGFLLARTDVGTVLLASAAAYLPGAQDGWDWCVDDLLALVAGRSTFDDAVEPARILGGLVARMHLAFATAYDGCADPVSWAGATEVAAWGQRAGRTLDEALAVTVGEPGERLRARASAARDALGALADVAASPATTPLTRVHGDLHVGQVLRWDGGYAVSDFDGNPVLPALERGLPQPPARDVAGMLRALDHVGRIVDRRTGGTASALVDRWIAASRTAFRDAYVAELTGAGRAELFDPRLVRPFEVEQECREYVYAARHLPRWTYVPDTAMGPLLDEPLLDERVDG